jgi:DNA repair protein RadC
MSDEARPAYRITDLPAVERPRERLSRLGAQALNSAELLAILLRTGVPGENAVMLGERLLRDLGGLPGLQRAGIEELSAQRGLGPAKAAQLKAAVELGQRLSMQDPEARPAVHSPADAAALLQYEMAALEQEHLRVVLLDTRNRVLQVAEIYRGSLNSSQVRIAEVFKPAIRRNAAAILVVHNHPSGDPDPSPEDLAVTRAIVQAGKLLDIEVLDHIIIGQGRGRWVSLKERGLGFN